MGQLKLFVYDKSVHSAETALETGEYVAHWPTGKQYNEYVDSGEGDLTHFIEGLMVGMLAAGKARHDVGIFKLDREEEIDEIL